MTPTRSTGHRLAVLGIAAIAACTFIAAPAAAFAAPEDNGGSTRNDGDQTEAIRDALVDGPAKNVILLIGDGMGDSEITVARNYAEGAGGDFAGIDALPLTGQYTTYALNADGTPNYASESASTASAWSTGTKAVNGSLSVDIAGDPQSTLLEIAKANGMKTGDVSTAEIQDATPGAQVAHITKRGCYGPVTTTANCSAEALENGGLGSISEQLLNLRPDVVLGGGSASFNEVAAAGPWQGQTLFDQAADRGYNVIDSAADLADVTAADAEQPLLGLFTPGNFPVRYTGPAATTGGGSLPAQSCAENPERLDSGLSLANMTSKAIDLLDNEDGFFLQVEGASIDKQDHAANACGQIGETIDLDEAVQVALEYAETEGDTLVVVTADHAHTSQIVGSTPPGLSVNLLTEEGQPMIVSYGTAGLGQSQQHTGSQVRIAGYGPGAANVLGLTDQTDLFFTSANSLDLERDLVSLSADATLSLEAAQVLPGATVNAAVTGLDADWQVTGAFSDEPLAQQDVLSGTASYALTAPTEPGTYSLRLVGSQTGTELLADVVVTETPVASPSPTETPAPGAAPGTPGGGGGSGALPITGASVGQLALLAMLLLTVGAAIAWRRRQRHSHI